MSFSKGASNNGGQFNQSNHTMYDHSRYETNHDSNNLYDNIITDSFNDNSKRFSEDPYYNGCLTRLIPSWSSDLRILFSPWWWRRWWDKPDDFYTVRHVNILNVKQNRKRLTFLSDFRAGHQINDERNMPGNSDSDEAHESNDTDSSSSHSIEANDNNTWMADVSITDPMSSSTRSKDCSGLPWGFSGQPAPVPVRTRTRSHGCGFLRSQVVGFVKPMG